jgi:hypothetical protein
VQFVAILAPVCRPSLRKFVWIRDCSLTPARPRNRAQPPRTPSRQPARHSGRLVCRLARKSETWRTLSPGASRRSLPAGRCTRRRRAHVSSVPRRRRAARQPASRPVVSQGGYAGLRRCNPPGGSHRFAATALWVADRRGRHLRRRVPATTVRGESRHGRAEPSQGVQARVGGGPAAIRVRRSLASVVCIAAGNCEDGGSEGLSCDPLLPRGRGDGRANPPSPRSRGSGRKNGEVPPFSDHAGEPSVSRVGTSPADKRGTAP